MSAFGGIWNRDSKPLDRQRLFEMSCELISLGPDDSRCYVTESVGMVYRAAQVTPEDKHEIQPYRSPTGNLLTWDGCLDNRADLISELHLSNYGDLPDVEIVSAAMEQWGEVALKKLVGDWSLAFWNVHDYELLLATDFVGNRRCYYCQLGPEIIWCSALAPIVKLNRGSLHLSDEFVAAYSYKATPRSLTPYTEVRLVDPGSSVRISARAVRVTSYWTWDGVVRLRYPKSSDYDEHFLDVFRTAVRRRLRTFKPVLAELSGGVDSSSVVCCANEILHCGAGIAPRLCTLSYYDDRDASGDERPYFRSIEELLGRTGYHINLADHDRFNGPFTVASVPFPGITPSRYSLLLELKRCHEALRPGTVLSGSGGDEMLGGLMDPVSHIAEQLIESRIGSLSLLEAWSLSEKVRLSRKLRQPVKTLLTVR